MEPEDREARLRRLARLRSEAAELERALDAPAAARPVEVDEALEREAFQLLADHCSDMLSIHSDAGVYQFASASAEALFGHRPEDLVGRSAYELFHPDDLERIAADHASHAESDWGRVRYRLRCGDGRYRWVETRSRARRGEDGVERIVAITTDVDEEEQARRRAREAESALVRARVEQVLARLAEGVAHEVNNALTAALAEMPEDGAGELEASLRRIQHVSRELTELGEVGPERPVRRDLAEEVRRALRFVPEAGRRRFRAELAPAPVECPPRDLRRLLHMVLHAHLPDPLAAEVRIGIRRTDDVVELHLEGPAPLDQVHADFGAVTTGEHPVLGPPDRIARRLAEALDVELSMTRDGDALRTRIRFSAAA
ncbi:MAG TPA: PAS domain S-box protein [Sandaracinaceae bacterium LLY-WYZ-13_1]|nr:PAS domain S-box protein [Sandaracinaceae bacterium LLY-WYZ-13_1]